MGIDGLEHLKSNDPIPYGVRAPDGTIIQDPTWFSEGDVMRGMIPFAPSKSALEVGTLVRLIDGEWREVRGC